MWYKLLLLLLYFIFLFTLARLLEIVSWYGGAVWCHKILDPMSLSVTRLKAILETRGIGYEGAVEKQDLSELVKATGVTTSDEMFLQLAETTEDDGLVTDFTHRLNFLEEVEDKKDSVWLVQVKVDQWPGAPLGHTTWVTVRKKLSKFGIRTGVFDCSYDDRVCNKKGWTTPRLILALPQTLTTKGNVTFYTYHGRNNERHILNWVKEKMAAGVTQIKDNDDLQNNWLSNKVKDDDTYEIRTIFFAKLAVLPLLFSALSFKFPGRVRFSVAGPEIVDKTTDSDMHDSNITNTDEYNTSSYVVVTNGQKYVYGFRPGEVFTFKRMELFLKTLYPGINDIFLVILFLSNWLSWLEAMLCRRGLVRRIARLLWYLIKYNVIVLIAVLPIIAVFRLPYIDRVVQFGLKFLQKFGTTTLAAYLRKDFSLYQTDICLFLSATALFSITIALFEYIRLRGTEEPQNDWMDLTNFMTSSYLYSPLTNLSPFGLSVYPNDTRQIELVNDNLIHPSLWLRPAVDHGYMRNLHTWSYKQTIHVNRCENCCKMDSAVKNVDCGNSGNPDVDFNVCCKNSKQPTANIISGDDDNRSMDNDQRNIHTHQHLCSPPGFESVNQFKKCKICGKKVREKDGKLHGINEGKKRCGQAHDVTNVVWSSHTVASSIHGGSVSVINGRKHHVDVQEVNTTLLDNIIDKGKILDNAVTSFLCDCTGLESASRTTHKEPQHVIECKCEKKLEPDFPPGFLPNDNCVICLDRYIEGAGLCGLPCGHSFHEKCIFPWLTMDKHWCPFCRWPSYKSKFPTAHFHSE